MTQPWPDWSVWAPVVAGLGGTLLGGAIAFISSAHLASRAEQRRRRDVLVARFEEIHTCVAAIRRGNHVLLIDIKACIEHGIVPKEFPSAKHHDRLSTLVDVYAPAILGRFEEARERDMAWLNAFRRVLDLKRGSNPGAGALLPELHAKWATADRALAAVQESAAQRARKSLGI